jgi:acyl-CoA thioester hydrolase
LSDKSKGCAPYLKPLPVKILGMNNYISSVENFIKDIQVRWSDLDPNIHLRHSVYYDWGAYSRVSFFDEHQLSLESLHRLKIGPILFREECVFRREVRLGDKVTISLVLTRSKKDFSRWTIQHSIQKNGDTLAAIITVDGAWLDVINRKLAVPPKEIHEVFSIMPRDAGFQWLD